MTKINLEKVPFQNNKQSCLLGVNPHPKYQDYIKQRSDLSTTNALE